ncbi:hypothetical protein ACS5PU_02150 [Pedobacter sp. GSP4]|uniref:hypothetical protein n=1 Tax=Pedobacter sp. GSP4 TaxID=3453716 RepID=UPI003EF01777
MFLVQGGMVLVLAAMAYQDFRYRGIYWWLFPVLLFLIIAEAYLGGTVADRIRYAAANVSFILFQVLLLSAYISLRVGRLTNIFNGYLGLGDLLYLLCISPAFPFLNYVFFYVASLMLVILLSLLFRKTAKVNGSKIPLAGYQALLLMLVLTVGHFSTAFDFRSGVSLFNLLPDGY